MADITIDAAASTRTGNAQRGLVFTTSLIGYCFFIDADADFKYLKTTDGGATWSGLTTVFTGTVAAFDVWFDQWTSGDAGTLIHTWYIESDISDTVLRYRTLDTSGDTLGTERIVHEPFVLITAAFGTFVSGAKARGGNLLCAYSLGVEVLLGTRRSTDGGTTWGSRTNMVEANGDKAFLFPGNATDSQDMWALYVDSSADSITLKVHDDSANTNSESAEVAPCIDNTTDGTGQNPCGGAIRQSDGHLLAAIWTEYDSATGDFRVFDINGTGSITEKTAIATNQDDCYYPGIFVDDLTGNLYVSYIGKRDGSETIRTTAGMYYVKSTDGGTNWSAGDTAYSATASDWKSNLGPPNGPRFAVAWMDISSLAILMNFDNSLVLGLSKLLTASLSFVGSLVRLPKYAVAGALTSSGSVAYLVKVPLSGAMMPAGSLIILAKQALSGALTTAGALSGLLIQQVSLAGALSFLGTLSRLPKPLLTGAVTFAGVVSRTAKYAVAGAVSFSGGLASKAMYALAGTLNTAGAVAFLVKYPLTGALTFSGDVARKVTKALTGALSFVGSLVGSILPFSVALNSPKFRYRPRWLVRLRVGAETKKYSNEDLDTP